MSILTEKFKTKHNSAPFTNINIEDYYPAFVQNIEKARIEIDEIIQLKNLALKRQELEIKEQNLEVEKLLNEKYEEIENRRRKRIGSS